MREHLNRYEHENANREVHDNRFLMSHLASNYTQIIIYIASYIICVYTLILHKITHKVKCSSKK